MIISGHIGNGTNLSVMHSMILDTVEACHSTENNQRWCPLTRFGMQANAL